jgi:DNA-directed RNA polymerase subunit alpha
MNKPIFQVNTIKQDDSFGQFAIEPLENGFGHTIGNALRRVLLSSFEGSAITQVKVKGVNHKFSTLEGMSEDMIDLVLNLKNVKVAYSGEEPVSAKLKLTGPKTVKASDIVAPASVKIVTPDVEIAKLAKGATLEMELEISTGFGYSPAETRTSDVIGVIPMDAIFSPVERVAYKVEATRVGRRTDYDKLLIDIYTDGSVSPLEVLKDASRTLSDYFVQVYDPTLASVEPQVSSTSSTESISLEELGLPTRITNALKNADYEFVTDLVDATNKDLKNVKNLGGKSIELLDESLLEKGFERNK